MSQIPQQVTSNKVLLLVCSIVLSAASTQAADRFWSGGTADYTNPTWTGGVIPGPLDNAINDHGIGNAVQISIGNPDWTVGQIRAGNSLGNGAFIQNGQTVTALGTNYNGPVISEFFTPFRLGIVAADSGVYTLNGGTLNYGTGPLNVGEVGTGTMNINGGTISGSGYFSVNPGGIAVPNPAVVTGTAGHGPYLGDFTYYEVGYAPAPHAGTGLPAAGTTITSVTQGDHSYQFAPTYTANDAVILDTAVPSATITLTTPAVCSGLSFMGSAGNGPVVVNYTVNYASGAPDTGSLSVPDWFGTGQEVLNVEGRVDGTGVNLQFPGTAGGNPVGNAPYLLSTDISLVNTDKVVSINLTYVSGGGTFATATILAVSGQDILGNPFTPLTISGYNSDVIVEASAPSPFVSNAVVDTVNQSNGTNDTRGEVHIGNGNDGHGNRANGTYNMTGGALNAHNWLSIGRSGGNGVFNLNGGSVLKTNDVGGNFLIGDGSLGVLNQTNGSVDSYNDITIGQGGGAVGTWNLAGGQFTLHPNCWFTIGRSGPGATGTLNMSGGQIDTYDEFHTADGTGDSGTINLSGGLINAHSWMQIGRGGAGLLNFTGGTIHKFNNGDAFIIGDQTTDSAKVIQTGAGTLFQDDADFWIGNNTTAEYDLTNGTLVVNAVGGNVGALIVGNNSFGTFEQSGGHVTANGQFWIGQAANSGGSVYDLSGGGTMTNHSWVSIGRNGGSGTLNLVSGSISKDGNGGFSIGGDGGATGAFNQSAGTSLTVSALDVTYLGQGGGFGTWEMNGSANLGVLQFCEAGNGSGLLNLNAGGVITATEVNAGTNATPPSNSTFTFAGGTLRAASDNPNFFHDVTTVNLNADAIIDSQGYNVTVIQNLPNGTASTFGLVKNGSGTLTLAGTNTYTGATTVNGILGVTTAAINSSSGFTVANGGLAVQVVGALNSQTSLTNVSLAASDNTFNVDLGGFGNPTVAPLNIAGTFANNGAIIVNIADTAPALGQIPLLQYAGTMTGSGSFTVGSLPTGVSGTIVNNVGNHSIDLLISGLNQPRWDGQAGGTWDAGSDTNWVNIGTGLPTTYVDPSLVVFDDNAAGTTTVTLPGTVNPLGITVNNSNLVYTFTGPGKISGSHGLTKMGTNVLTIATTNNYTGPTVVANGTLNVAQLANFGTPSPIGAAGASPTNLVIAGGVLSYSGPAITLNRPYTTAAGAHPGGFSSVNNVTVTSLVSGNGGVFQKQGPSTLAYVAQGSNDLTGYRVNNSAYQVGAGALVLDGSAGQTNYSRSFFTGTADGVDTSVILTNTTLWVRDGFILGQANANTTMTITNSTINYEAQDGNNFEVGDNGANPVNAVFNQNGGLVNLIGGQMFIGNGNNVTGGNATYNMNGGTLNEHDWWVTGRNGSTGTFNLNAGTINKDGNPFITSSAGAGVATVGTFNMTNGVLNCNAELWVAENSGNIGTNNFGGTAQINLNNWVSLGRGGLGVMNLTGNAILHKLNPNNSERFNIADGNQSGGTGILNQQDNSQLNIDGDLDVGHGGSGTANGTYNMNGGTAYVNGWLSIGRGGSGITATVNLTNGSIAANNGGYSLIIGNNDGGGSGTATYNQAGGQFESFGETHVAEVGWTSTMNISGGLFIAHSWFQIGRGNGGTGALNLSGGTVHHLNNGGVVLCDGGNGNLCTITETGGYFTSDGGDWLIGNGPGGGLWDQSSGTNLSLGGNTFIGSGGPCTINLSGNASWTANGWFVVGGSAGNTGTLNISGTASLTKNGSSGDHLSIGDGGGSGAQGVINQTGGTITSLLSDTYLGAQSSGTGASTGTWNLGPGTAVLSDLRFTRDVGTTGIMNLLAGGTLTVGEINTNGPAGSSTFHFNGGTLKASASDATFMQGLTLADIQSGGATIDTAGNNIAINQALADGGGGGLTKVGNGTLRLNGVNTYTGPTTVSAGALGGSGTIPGPVVVSAGATLSPGNSIGTLTLGSTLNLAGTSTTVMEVNKTALTSDLVTGATTITFGGTLVLKNLSGTLQPGDTFTLFNAGSFVGTFSSVVSQTPNQTVTWDLSQLAPGGNGTVKVATAVVAPVTLSPSVSGGRLNFSWPANQIGWQLQHQVNPLTLGLSTNWVSVAGSTTTNAVSAPIDSTEATDFYRLVFPAQ